MGGVDKLDFLLSLYRIHIKSKKWTLCVIFHFIDLAVVTCWLQYMRDCNSISIPMRERFSLLDFRLHISESMIKHGTNPLSKKKGRKSAQYAPVGDVRYDAVGHFPIWKEDRERCKKEDCKDHFSHVFCAKYFCVSTRIATASRHSTPSPCKNATFYGKTAARQ